MTLIKKELLDIKKLFPIPRRTQIVKGDTRIELQDENAAVTEEMAVAFCADMKVRKWPSRLFTLGEISADKPWQVVKIMGDRKLRLFTDRGDMLMLNVADIPETRPTARAVSLTSLLAFEKNEQIVAVFPEDGEGLTAPQIFAFPSSPSLAASAKEGGRSVYSNLRPVSGSSVSSAKASLDEPEAMAWMSPPLS